MERRRLPSARISCRRLALALCLLLAPTMGCELFGQDDDPAAGVQDTSWPVDTAGGQDAGPTALGALGEGTVPAPAVTGQLTLGNAVGLAHETVDSTGGTITAFDGLTIEVPAGAHDSPATYTIESEEIVAHTFGDDVLAMSPLYHVDNGGVVANEPLIVTIPVQLTTDQFAMGFYYDSATGRLEGLPLLALDETSVTVVTRHFSDVVVLAPRGVNVGQTTNVDIDTGFRPGKDDWQFPNKGSAIKPGGQCSGQSLSAMWYFTEQRVAAGAPALFGRYDNTDGRVSGSPWPATTDFWQDDQDGYHLACVIQKDQYRGGMGDHEKQMMNLSKQRWDALQYSAFILSMRLTGEPQFVAVDHYANDGSFDGGHAMIVYGANDAGLYVADPNFPGVFRTIVWNATSWTLGPYNSLLNIKERDNTSFEVVGYSAKSGIFDWNRLGGRWDEFQAGTVGDGEFPNYTLMAQTTDDLGATTSFDLMGERVVTALEEAELTVEVPGYDWRLTVYDGATEIGQATSTGTVAFPVTLDEGDNEFGFLIEVAIGQHWEYVDFDRLTLVRGVGLDEEMVPDEGEALAMGMLVKSARSVQTDPATGEITSVSAIYKAAPTADGAPDPADVCMGSGWGGADAGYGPNLCLAVTLTLPQPPCEICFNVDAVRAEFTNPSPCDATFTRYPCVSSAGPAYDRGVQIWGFENEDRNVELAHMIFRTEVLGVRVDISTAYRTYAAEQTMLLYMEDVVSALGAWIAAEIRILLG